MKGKQKSSFLSLISSTKSCSLEVCSPKSCSLSVPLLCRLPQQNEGCVDFHPWDAPVPMPVPVLRFCSASHPPEAAKLIFCLLIACLLPTSFGQHPVFFLVLPVGLLMGPHHLPFAFAIYASIDSINRFANFETHANLICWDTSIC